MSDAAISSDDGPDRFNEKDVKIDKIARDDEADLRNGDMENGHLKELEVDVSKVLEEEGLEDIDGDDSPYPEGMFLGDNQLSLLTLYQFVPSFLLWMTRPFLSIPSECGFLDSYSP